MRRSSAILHGALLALLLAGCDGRSRTPAGPARPPAQTAPASAPSNQESAPMVDDKLPTLIAARNPSAIELARQRGPAALAQLNLFLADKDDGVRVLAVDCVIAAGGPEAPGALIKMLDDPNEQVRINAVNGLHKQLPVGREQALIAVWDRTRDEYIRQQIPMVLGRTKNPQAIQALKGRATAAIVRENGEIRDGMTSGLAKAGDAEGREAFAKLLADARGERVKEVIDLVQYVDEKWVVPKLRPVLDRKEIAVDLSSHRTTLKRRGCDLAVDEVARISGQKFAFQPDGKSQYTDPQLQEVIRYVDSLPR